MNFLEKVESGLASLNAGNVSKAADLLQELGALPPEDSSDKERAKFFEFSGNLAMAQSRFSDAYDAYTFMIRYEERSGESRGGIGNSWGKIGEALASLDRHLEATPCFERGLKMMAEDGFAPEFRATLNFQLAESFHALENYRDAAREYQNTLNLIGSDGDGRSIAFVTHRMASALGTLAMLEHTVLEVRAMQEQLKAMGMDSSALDDVLGGFSFPDLSYAEQAISAYRDAISNPAYAESAVSAQIDLGRLLQHLGKVEDAAETLAEGLAFSDSFPDKVTPKQRIDLLHELGMAYLSLDALEIAEPMLGAASELRRAQGLASGWSDIGLARIESARKNHDKAIRLGRESVLNIDEFQRADAMLAFADILDAAGQEIEATQVREEAQTLLAEH